MLYIDLISSILVVSLSVVGLFRGLFTELFSILSWVGSILIGWYFSPNLFPYISEIITNPQGIKIASFISIFFISFILIRATGNLLSSFVSALGLGIFDKLFGFVFGALKSISILFILIFLFEPLISEKTWWIESFTSEYFYQIKTFLDLNLDNWDQYIDQIFDKDGDPSLPSV